VSVHEVGFVAGQEADEPGHVDRPAAAGEDDLAVGDAMKIYGPETITLTSPHPADVILVDVPLDFQPVGVWGDER
jgi:hypothetical protein